jgi:hypothetical protein
MLPDRAGSVNKDLLMTRARRYQPPEDSAATIAVIPLQPGVRRYKE